MLDSYHRFFVIYRSAAVVATLVAEVYDMASVMRRAWWPLATHTWWPMRAATVTVESTATSSKRAAVEERKKRKEKSAQRGARVGDQLNMKTKNIGI